jgi:hypothetical protein
MARLVPIVGAVAAALFGNFFFEVVAAAGDRLRRCGICTIERLTPAG